jgi:uncharacterized OsmC-like protein
MATIKIQLNQNSETSVELQHNQFNITIDRPIEKGGNGKGLMGGQYMLAGVGGCFCSTLFAAAQARDIQIEGLSVIVSAMLSEEHPKRFMSITLDATYENCNQPSEFEKLLTIAEQGCISVNTIKNDVAFNVNS